MSFCYCGARDVYKRQFYGMAKHADCHTLFKKLTGKDMSSFKDLNVAYKPEDGKKRFPGVVVSIRELVNLPDVYKRQYLFIAISSF